MDISKHVFALLRSAHQSRVATMMEWYGQDTPTRPQIPDDQTVELRVRLPLEEVFELARDSGFQIRFNGQAVEYKQLELVKVGEPCLPDVVDALVDLSVVVIGGLAAYGVPDTPVLEEVDRNNLKKLAGGSRNAVTGKFDKSPDHKPPDIVGVLVSLGWEPS